MRWLSNIKNMYLFQNKSYIYNIKYYPKFYIPSKHIPSFFQPKEPLSRDKITLIAMIPMLFLLASLAKELHPHEKVLSMLLGEFQSCHMISEIGPILLFRCWVPWHHQGANIFAKILSSLVSHHWVPPSPPDAVMSFHSLVIGTTKRINICGHGVLLQKGKGCFHLLKFIH